MLDLDTLSTVCHPGVGTSLREGRELDLPTLEQNVEIAVEETSFHQPYLPESDAIREAALAAFDLVMAGTTLRQEEWGEKIRSEPWAEAGATLDEESEAAG